MASLTVPVLALLLVVSALAVTEKKVAKKEVSPSDQSTAHSYDHSHYEPTQFVPSNPGYTRAFVIPVYSYGDSGVQGAVKGGSGGYGGHYYSQPFGSSYFYGNKGMDCCRYLGLR